MNSVVLIGRLGKDPELRFTTSGKAVATFSIAVNRPFSKTKEVDFFNVVVWGKSAENCANYIKKGSMAGIQGRLQSRSYETQNGEKRYVTEVVADQVEFLDSKGNQSSQSGGKNASNDDFNPSDINLDDFEAVDDDEDIPF